MADIGNMICLRPPTDGNRKIGKLSDFFITGLFAFRVIFAPNIFFRTQDSAPKVNLNFHKCEDLNVKGAPIDLFGSLPAAVLFTRF